MYEQLAEAVAASVKVGLRLVGYFGLSKGKRASLESLWLTQMQ